LIGYVPGLRRDDWPLQDPKGLPIAEVREIRDEIEHRVQSLIRNERIEKGVKIYRSGF
jgi:arsenate reductase